MNLNLREFNKPLNAYVGAQREERLLSFAMHDLIVPQRTLNEQIRLAVFRSPSRCAVTCCRCNHADTLEAFTETPIRGQTPSGVFQCPACKRAWSRELGHDKYGALLVRLADVEASL